MDVLKVTMEQKPRNNLLDFSRGVAILLVVTGHLIQSRFSNFDDQLIFRMIYSFHMPLFAFLSGAAAVGWVKEYDINSGVKIALKQSLKRTNKAIFSLLLPFASWTLINYFISAQQQPLLFYVWDVFQHPDISLWFLPCIFWCILYVSVGLLLISVLNSFFREMGWTPLSYIISFFGVKVFFMYLIWNKFAHFLPTSGGLVFTNIFHKGLYYYFLLGMVFFDYASNVRSVKCRAIPYILFFMLVPFWYRTTNYNFIILPDSFTDFEMVLEPFSRIVAISGILIVIDLSRMITAMKTQFLTAIICYLGSVSLGIYALHFHFLSMTPVFFAPILISVIIYSTLIRFKYTGLILFGKYDLKYWEKIQKNKFWNRVHINSSA